MNDSLIGRHEMRINVNQYFRDERNTTRDCNRLDDPNRDTNIIIFPAEALGVQRASPFPELMREIFKVLRNARDTSRDLDERGRMRSKPELASRVARD